MKISSRALATCTVVIPFISKMTVLTVMCLLAFTDCNKSPEESEPIVSPPEPFVLSGKIILPKGSNLDLESMKVHALSGASVITDSLFNVAANATQFNTVFLATQEGKTLLMGYYLASDHNVSISVHTTALAMAMNTPTILSFSLEAKKEITNLVMASQHFEDLKSEIAASVSEVKDLFDESNLNLFKTLETLSEKLFVRL